MKKVEYIDLFLGADMTQRRLPVITVDAPERGPTVWLVAGCHGDEVTSVAVIHSVLDLLEEHPHERGTVHAIPMMNPMGGEMVQREVPLDGVNLNRVYPGDPHGGLTERIAARIFEAITAANPDLVLDLHTTDSRSLPHVILDRFTGGDQHPDVEARLMEAAKAFGVTVVYDFPMQEYVDQKLDRSLSGALLNRGRLISYTVELGPTRIVSDAFREVGVRGVFNMLRYLGMVGEGYPAPGVDDSTLQALGPVLQPPTPLRRDRDLVGNSTGLVQFLVKAGDEVRKGQELARIRNVLGEVVETLHAERGGYVLQLADRAVVLPGTPALTLAIPDLP